MERYKQLFRALRRRDKNSEDSAQNGENAEFGIGEFFKK
jgi:hypothetical protein